MSGMVTMQNRKSRTCQLGMPCWTVTDKWWNKNTVSRGLSSSSGLLTILVKSFGNTNINTFAKNYCQYRYCCRKVLTIPILLQAILFLLIQRSQVRLRGGPIWLRFFFFVSVVVNFNSALRFCMPHIFHLELTKGLPMWGDSIEQRQQSGLIFSLATLAIRLS